MNMIIYLRAQNETADFRARDSQWRDFDVLISFSPRLGASRVLDPCLLLLPKKETRTGALLHSSHYANLTTTN